MTHSFADVLQTYLVSVSLGTLGGAGGTWPIFLNGEPNEPDNCITIYDTDGRDYARLQPTGDQHGPAGIQVRVRAVNHRTGWTKADAIRSKLLASIRDDANAPYRRSVTVGSSSYVIECVVGVSDVLSLGKAPPNNRCSLFTINALIHAREV